MGKGISDLETAKENQDSIRLMYAGQKLRGSVLDVGCNSGFLMRHLRFNYYVKEYLGLEGDDKLVEQARALARELEPYKGLKWATILQVDLEKDMWPALNGHFDGAFCGEVIEHIKDTKYLLNSIWGALKPGGLLILTTPLGDGKHVGNPDHEREYTMEELKEMVRAANFEIVGKQVVSQNPQRWTRLIVIMECRKPA